MKDRGGKATRKHYGGGLYLQISAAGAASWLMRYQRNGTEHWMGLGPKRAFTAKEARSRARKFQQQIYDDIDPIQARRDQRALQALQDARTVTFESAAEQYYRQHESKWSSAKHRQAFLNTLQQYAHPIIGKLPVAAVDTAAVLRIIEPIWIAKNKTASRIRGRIEAVLDWSTVRGFRAGDNPARWQGHLDQVLPSGGDFAKPVHHAALPYADVAAFVAGLAQHKGIGPKALEFIILTACRTSEVTKARWGEFDLEQKFWTVPAERMKARKPHRVPLTGRMIKLLKALPREQGNDLVFIGTRKGGPLSKMTLPTLIEATGHSVTTEPPAVSAQSPFLGEERESDFEHVRTALGPGADIPDQGKVFCPRDRPRPCRSSWRAVF